MAEYRNVEPLKKEIADLKRTIHSGNTDYQTGYMSALSVVEGMIAEQPSADVEPVRRGEWIIVHEHTYLADGTRKDWDNFFCSECYTPENAPRKFCAECGAKMGGEESEK